MAAGNRTSGETVVQRNYLAFDIEIAKDFPDFSDWRRHRPLGITCAATLAADEQEPRLWHGVAEGGGPADQMSRDEAAKLVERYGWAHLATGDMFREALARRDPVALEAQDIMKAGKLVPDFDLENYHYYHCKPAFIHDHFTWDELKAHRDRITDAYLGWFYSPEQFRRRRRDKLAFYLSHPAAALDRVLSGV